MGIWKNIAVVVFLVAAAVGLGLYVFPERPWIGWGLLFFCWGCYRLKMRADRLFRDRRVAAPASPDAFPESGSKGGARRGSGPGTFRRDATLLERYHEWRESGDETIPVPRPQTR